MRADRGCRLFRGINEKPSARFLEHFHGFEDVLFAFLAKTSEVAEFPFFCDALHVGYRAGLKVGPQKGDFLWAERLQLQHVQKRRRIFLQQLLAQRVVAGLHNLLEMFDHAVADSRQFLELFRLLHQLLDRFRQAVNQLGRLLVAAISADNGAVDFEELRGFAQYACNLFVVHGGKIINPGAGGK